MAKVKLSYGIDLGTTNSAICKMENGEPVIRKTDTLKDTLPSCVSFTKKRVIRVGDGAYNDLRQDKARASKKWSDSSQNVFIEFKRTMGLDTAYQSSNMDRSYSSEELSAEVLKTLKSFVTEENINAAVITIPAKFTTDQVAATKRAATLAGIEHCELLQEPIAASMAYGLTSEKKDGIWLVFDFGGGTFDAALIQVEDGIMQVIDTEGDNYLGGKNLDYAIVDEILIPYLQENYEIGDILEDDKKRTILRDAVKYYAEQAKNQLSFNDKADVTSQLDEYGEDDEGEEIELDLIITRAELTSVLTPIFQKAINITKQLLERNNIAGADLDSLILVGGPTYSPILRDMLKKQITAKVKTDIDPMTAVARGAALYASGIDCEIQQEVASGTIALDISYESSSVEESEFVAVRLLPEESTGDIPSRVFVEFTRADKAWSSGKVEISGTGEVIECQLRQGKSNSFAITAYDSKGNIVPCFPSEINIMQGMVVGNAVLPYHIGVEAQNPARGRDEFVPLAGLEKNKQLPATGVRNGFKTPFDLRPGISKDCFRIPIYQGEYNTEGTSAIYNDHVCDILISGDDVPELIPANSDIDITIKVDASQIMTLEAFFPLIGETVEKPVKVEQRSGVTEHELEDRLDEARNKLDALKSSDEIAGSELAEASKIFGDVRNRFDGEKSSEDGKMHLLADLRRAFRAMEEVENAHEWEALEAELRSEFERLEKANDDLGNKYDDEVEELRGKTEAVLAKKDIPAARSVLKSVEECFIQVTFVYQLIGFIKHNYESFDASEWTNASRARALLNQGMEIVNSEPTVGRLRPIISQLFELLVNPNMNDKIKL